ncbi:MAG: 1,4-alpha-glucan branching protein GlgB [Sphingomonadales bacterium]
MQLDTQRPVWNYSLFTADDLAQYHQGTHCRLYEKMGSRSLQVDGVWGCYFSVWAPNATHVSVVGNFNDWNNHAHLLFPRWEKSGIWEGFIPGVKLGEVYKYHITGHRHQELDKGDPFAFFWEKRPQTASITWDLYYEWKDQAWMQNRHRHNSLQSAWSVYEVHLASWRRPGGQDENAYLSYDQLSETLVPYVQQMGFTHVELMPIMEHPFDGSWGYQCTGYFAPTSRFGDPQGLMRLIDAFHAAGIGVILDWVPSHFPYDAHGLYLFDGANTYEYADRRKGFHPDWNSYVFNYKRGEVRSFLISSAHFWFDLFHVDAIRVDAVSSMLKLNYSRKAGEWEPNEQGGDGNLEAIDFLKELNRSVYERFPDVQTIAEEATDWPGISRPIYQGGLGFGMKWMMGWMHDTLRYFKLDPLFRKHHQDRFTFSLMYYYDENFMLPFSHDEVVHGKSPMIYKMPGDEWQKFANLRLLYSYMFTHPGAKLLFMGAEFGQTAEWDYRSQLQWHLLQYPIHNGLSTMVKELNQLLTGQPALFEKQFDPSGFEWIDLDHRSESVVVYRRKGIDALQEVLVVLNMTPVVYRNWTIIVSGKEFTTELFNSDATKYGGAGTANNPILRSECLSEQDSRYRLTIDIPALAGIVLI